MQSILKFVLLALLGVFSSSASAAPTPALAQFFRTPEMGWRVQRVSASQIAVLRTQDGGAHWESSTVPASIEAESAFLQFTDASHGFLLLLDEPAGGMMQKIFCCSFNCGQTWRKIADSSERGSQLPGTGFYPGGLTFRNASQGWISGQYRSSPAFPLLTTRNGGRTWQFQNLPVPLAFRKGGYGNTQAPVFFGPDRMQGVLPVEMHLNRGKSSVSRLVLLTTRDGGHNWRPLP